MRRRREGARRALSFQGNLETCKKFTQLAGAGPWAVPTHAQTHPRGTWVGGRPASPPNGERIDPVTEVQTLGVSTYSLNKWLNLYGEHG